MQAGSYADNWSFQLLDECLLPIARVSSYSATLVHNQLLNTKGADAWELIVDVQGGILQCPPAVTHADSSFQCPSRGKKLLMLVGHSCADSSNAQLLELSCASNQNATGLNEQLVFSAGSWDSRGGAWDL